jgi:hypothetical protein
MWMHEFASSAESIVSNPALINADSYRLVRQYKQKCLASTSAFVAGAALRTTTAQAMGVLFHKAGGWGVVCSVTRVAPGLVLTARHCFYERGSTTVSAGLADAVAANRYKVLLPDMAIEMLVTGVRCADAADLASLRCLPYSLFPSTQAGFASDFIVLEVAEPAGLAPPRVVLNSAGVERGMAIMLVSWNLFGAIDATYQHFEQALSPAAAEADFRQTAQLSMSRGGTCAIATVRNACITHTCQSTPGSSGAALFAPQADGSIRILAVHVADMNASASYMQEDSCDFGGLRVPANFYHTTQVVNFGNAGRLLNR